MPAPKNDTTKSWYQTDRGRIIAVATGAALLIGASFSVQAVAESKPYQHMKLLMGNEGGSTIMVHKAGWGDRGWFGGKHRRGGHSRFANMTDAELEKAISRGVRHLAIEIDASAEQQEKIIRLATAVAKDMRSKRGEFKAAGEKMRGLLLAPTIDRAALEAVRAERFAEAEKISKELVTALADVADTLTLEQRKVVEERIQQFRSMRKRWHRG